MAQARLGVRLLQVFASKCTITRSLAVITIMLMGIVMVSFNIPIHGTSIKYLANVSSETIRSTLRELRFDDGGGQGTSRVSGSDTFGDEQWSTRLFESTTAANVMSPVGKTLTNIANMYKVKTVSCHDVFLNTNNATRDAVFVDRRTRRQLKPAEHYLNITENCTDYQNSRGYIMSSLSQEEEEFPLAYSMLTYKDPEMVERLLHVIYRPQNYYCIHVDRKSPESFYKAIDAIARCFHNVFIATERIDVRWGQFSVLKPELVCMSDLLRYKKWKYFINLTGQEFPLKTNYELVKILKAYKGANEVSGTIKHANTGRWRKAGKPPHGIRAVKGSVHVVLNRGFVDYMLNNKTAQAFLNWTMKTSIPDETFFASLNYNPHLGIKGTYKGHPDTDEQIRPFVARHKIWGQRHLCSGRFVRSICQLSTGDLPLLGRSTKMFANKFLLAETQLVISCLEEKLLNDTRDEYFGIKTFNTSYYEHNDQVINQVQ